MTLFLLGSANGLAGTVIGSIVEEGFWGALRGTFGLSVVVLFAIVVALNFVRRQPEQAIDRLDQLVFALYLVALCVPRSAASMVALTGLAVYQGVRGRCSAEAIASASLFVGIATCHMWGLLLLQLCAPLILSLDAALAAGALNLIQGGGATSIGNLVETAQGQPLLIATGCSSLSHVSYALLCWLTLVRVSRPAFCRADFGMALGLAAAVVGVNVLRMALMGVSRDAYELVHGPLGAQATNALILAAALAAAWLTLAIAPVPARHAAA